jgi:hypothetical protein
MGRRIGRFRISGEAFERMRECADAGRWDELEGHLKFQGEVLILRTHDCPSREWVEYWGISKHFEEIEEGEDIPEYDIWFERVIEDCPACQGVGCCDLCEQGKVHKSRFKTAKRWPYRVLHIPGEWTDEQLAEFKRKWEETIANLKTADLDIPGTPPPRKDDP